MTIATQQDQAQTDRLAREYVELHGMKIALKLSRERGDRLQAAIMVATMELSLGHVHRAQEVLNQAITS